jgi:hypothetical protein
MFASKEHHGYNTKKAISDIRLMCLLSFPMVRNLIEGCPIPESVPDHVNDAIIL